MPLAPEIPDTIVDLEALDVEVLDVLDVREEALDETDPAVDTFLGRCKLAGNVAGVKSCRLSMAGWRSW